MSLSCDIRGPMRSAGTTTELARARERIAELEAQLALLSTELPAEALIAERLRLTTGQAHILTLLLTRALVTRSGLMQWLWGWRWEEKDPKGLDVRMCGLRKAVRPHGVEVETVYGTGWRLTDSSRRALKARIGG
jgi:two-component system, cell cycle response regulator CtrA